MTQDTTQEQAQVVIVGGGLTGLSAAVFLAAHGVRATLVERHPDTSTHPKARAINPRTMELYRAVGMEERVRAGRSPISGNTDLVHVETLAGNERVRMPNASPDDIGRISPTQWTLIDQNQLEPILRERAVEAGADVRFHTRVDAVEQDADGVLLRTTDLGTGESGALRASYVIAADGSRSPVREMLSIGAHGRGTLTHLVSFFFEADLEAALRGRKIIAAYVNNPEVRGTIIPIDNDRRWVINVSFFPDRGESADDFTEERCVELVRAAVGIPGLPLKVESVAMPAWDISARVADASTTRRIFVAGDAAHVMPPTGAFGASTGIQDAYNLAWKLALVLNGQAGPGLLESYAAERKPVAEETVKQAMLRFAVREGKQFRDVENELLDETTMTFGYCYPAGAFVAENGSPDTLIEDPEHPSGRPGARAPHVPLDGEHGPLSTLDLFGGGFVLLADSAAGHWAELADRAVRELGLTLTVHSIGSGAGLRDQDGQFRQRYGLLEGGAVLVRPDGFVCWRATTGRPGGTDNEIAGALRRVLARA
ncbi:FAD-dependent oxidoreductase [Streptomyces sp. NBC_01754]|uniref:FAD-dependent oxidoreductase n=1 Tax=Streptomyces sp. NBC_01754 TaxID=2975930 RepID=UPI002DDB9A60|nr:FAD-dependent oxidoreductase [Streptomyces sp. NBC_01754]WSC90839.1 FAD-dependent oxidoreductase [Streptomyces sp. NBC_01754]WSC96666.1 FAD-dependent oxidoreductase [Streptomyces sp. NBC_01754]